MSGHFAFIFGSLDPMEILVVGMAAIMIFGGKLPEVMLRLVAQVMRARRAVSRMWRETGLEDELRRVRRDIENAVPRDAEFKLASGNSGAPKSKAEEARAAAEKARAAARKNADEAQARKYGDAGSGPEADREAEAYASDAAVPDWSGGGPAPGEAHEVDPDADRREPFTFEPMEDAIASGDDWSAGVDTDAPDETPPAPEAIEPAPPAPTPRLGQFGEGVPDDRS